MSAGLQRLEWDSDFFGFGIGRVTSTVLKEDEAKRVTAEARSSGIRCVYFLADSDSPDGWRAAASAGFDAIDIRLELVLAPPRSQHERTLANPADEQTLVDIAREQAFSVSRFYRDDRFPREKATEMFVIWTRRGVHDERWFTVVERRESAIDGFVTARLTDHVGSIDLAAVAERARGRGVGRRIIAGAIAEFSSRGATRINVVTQGSNLAAQNLYLDAGFRPSSCSLWFHWWDTAAR